VVSTNEAVKWRIERHHPKRVAVITPYVDELNDHIRAGLDGRGLNFVRIWGLGITENFALASAPPARIIAVVDFDLLFVSCTNFRGLAARPALLEWFGAPVVTSNQATIEVALEALGLAPDGGEGTGTRTDVSAPAAV
jgi:maleate isomerase